MILSRVRKLCYAVHIIYIVAAIPLLKRGASILFILLFTIDAIIFGVWSNAATNAIKRPPIIPYLFLFRYDPLKKYRTAKRTKEFRKEDYPDYIVELNYLIYLLPLFGITLPLPLFFFLLIGH